MLFFSKVDFFIWSTLIYLRCFIINIPQLQWYYCYDTKMLTNIKSDPTSFLSFFKVLSWGVKWCNKSDKYISTYIMSTFNTLRIRYEYMHAIIGMLHIVHRAWQHSDPMKLIAVWKFYAFFIRLWYHTFLYVIFCICITNALIVVVLYLLNLFLNHFVGLWKHPALHDFTPFSITVIEQFGLNRYNSEFPSD